MQRIVACYGAGQKSLLAERVMRRHAPGMHVNYLVENRDFSKLGSRVVRLDGVGEPMEVISLEKLKTLYAAEECHHILVPAAYSVFDLREIRELCGGIGIDGRDIFAMPYNRLMAPLETAEDVLPPLVPFDMLEQIWQMDIHIVDHCNMTCRACGHFSNLVDAEVIYSAGSIEKSLSHLSGILPNIPNLSILGGEPLLHPELDRVLEITRECYPYAQINLATNGILVRKMPDSVCRALKDKKIKLILSIYPSLYDRIDEFIKFLREEGLAFSVNKCGAFERRLLPRPVFEKERMFAHCGHDMCLRGSRVGYCVNALFTDYYNKRFGGGLLPEDKGVDVFDHSCGKSFLEALHRPLELCRRCVACDAGKQYFRDWKLAADSPRAEDWFIDFPLEAALARDGG